MRKNNKTLLQRLVDAVFPEYDEGEKREMREKIVNAYLLRRERAARDQMALLSWEGEGGALGKTD